MKKISLIIAICGAICLNHSQSLFAEMSADAIKNQAEELIANSVNMKKRNQVFAEYKKDPNRDNKLRFFLSYEQARFAKCLQDMKEKSVGTVADDVTRQNLYKAAIIHLLDTAKKLGLLSPTASPETMAEFMEAELHLSIDMMTKIELRDLLFQYRGQKYNPTLDLIKLTKSIILQS